MRTIIFLAAIVALASCKGIVFPIEWPWTHFDPLDTADNLVIEKYLGKWYEIAVIPFYWERDCLCTYANYSLNTDGSIKVQNSCKYKSLDANFTTMTATAWVAESPSKLQVEFFYPFDARYWVLRIDNNHTYALIGEPTRKYLWILSRTPTLDTKTFNDLITYARLVGFPVDKLVKTVQEC